MVITLIVCKGLAYSVTLFPVSSSSNLVMLLLFLYGK